MKNETSNLRFYLTLGKVFRFESDLKEIELKSKSTIKMKTKLLIVTFYFCAFLQAQDTIKLEIDNIAPRVGDKLELSFSTNFLSEIIESGLKDGVKLSKTFFDFGNENAEFSNTIEFTSVGTHVIGPFRFDFNGTTIVTDSIIVDVAEELPNAEGIWVRLVTNQKGNKFIIIEQLVENKTELKIFNNGNEDMIGTSRYNSDEYAELSDFFEAGVTIMSNGSMIRNTKNSKAGVRLSPEFSYSRKSYKIDFTEEFDGEFLLQKKHFKNLPIRYSFKKILITE